MTFFPSLFITIFFGILTGVAVDLGPAVGLSDGTITALALSTGAMGVVTIINLATENF